jgi:hypothetical protein
LHYLNYISGSANSHGLQILLPTVDDGLWAVKECETPVGRVISGMEHAAKFYIVGEKCRRGAMDRCKVKFTRGATIDAISADGFV